MTDEHKARAREISLTALRLFAEKGFDGVSVRDICAELSVNSSIISYYFGGKKGLYLEVLRGQFNAWGQMMEELAARNLAAREAFLAVVDIFGKMRAAHPHFAALMNRESGRPSQEFRQAAAEYEARFGDALSDIIRAGQRQGVFKASLKLAALLPAIRALLSAPLTESHSFSEPDYVETVKILLLDGLMADAGEGDGRPIGKQSAKPRNAAGR